jgi:hypothetical protein
MIAMDRNNRFCATQHTLGVTGIVIGYDIDLRMLAVQLGWERILKKIEDDPDPI